MRHAVVQRGLAAEFGIYFCCYFALQIHGQVFSKMNDEVVVFFGIDNANGFIANL